ncbi:AraC family transcriptional regulator [Deinococcus enclensis]|uniref:AraC-like DNA-binding protein n=1 Tax=Deinococcus enclensis TaxID=1049582 RepID=A0ABT9MHI9_9DEIO|nr:AraC family transcriptional regulator [Deinococcus enclensis]MDP9766058.1 AraC-like DNA-binding protein [Deinococcus enclensis]
MRLPPVTDLPLAGYATLLELADYLPDCVVFLKDAQARYIYANQTLLQRLHVRDAADLVGRTSSDLFPGNLGESFTHQDRRVLAGQPLTEHLELHLYPNGRTGWCLTTKRALHDGTDVVGLLGLSRDLGAGRSDLPQLNRAVQHLHDHHDRPLDVGSLAAIAGMSVSSFERQVKRVYGLTPTQLLIRSRLEAATRQLTTTDDSIAQVAFECGYADHSAFTRAFRQTTGLTPRQFRQITRPGH